MAAANHTEVFNCSPIEFFKIVTDYERYSEFMSDVKGCKVVKTEGQHKFVEYNVSVIKPITYQLKTTETEPALVSWEFSSGDVFKTMSGSWQIGEAPGGKTKATYSVEATFKIFMPGPIANTLLNVNLPAMMASYHQRIKKVYGK